MLTSCILYTLPNCGICHMVSLKLKEKNIAFEEKDFSEIATNINSDHAPALKIEEDGETTIYNSPISIVQWINRYGA